MELEHHQLELRYMELRRKDERRERHIMASLAEHGQQMPVVVVPAEEKDRYILVDGYKRARALEKLRHDTVKALLWELSSGEALVLERLMREGEPDSPLEQGWLLRSLRDEHGLSLEELARRFDRSKSWVSRRIGLVDRLPGEVQAKVRAGTVPAQAAMKYLVPLSRDNQSDCVNLVTAIKEPLTVREVASLYTGYQEAAPAAKERLISEPMLYLRAQEAMRKETEDAELPPDRLFLRDLEMLSAIAWRLRRNLQKGLARGLKEEQRAAVLFATAQARQDTTTTFNRCEKELQNAGPSATHEHP